MAIIFWTIKVCYQLNMPYRDGTNHIIFEPLDHF